MSGFSCFDILSVVQDVDRRMLLEYMAGKGFMLRHALLAGKTSIITQMDGFDMICKSGIGISVEKEVSEFAGSDFLVATVAVFDSNDPKIPAENRLDKLYEMFLGLDCDVYAIFYPVTIDEVAKIKGDSEERISKIETRRTHGASYRDSGRNMSTGTDLYYQSFEKNMLQLILDNLDGILSAGCSSYKVAFAIKNNNQLNGIFSYLKSNAVIIDQKMIRAGNLQDLYGAVERLSAIPLSYSNASMACGFSARITRLNRVRTGRAFEGDISIGKYLDSGISETDDIVSVNSAVLNLGTLITGMPGTGKTKLAQNIIEQAHNAGAGAVIISPTGEWNGFGIKNSLKILDLGDERCKMNLFKCETGDKRKFYEGLAMLIAAGCNSGPYRNSVEKCLVAAFSRAYSLTSNPDPATVYGEIEEAIIEQHGKRTATSVKYTKHGENTRAALESLRQLLMMPQFAYQEGIGFSEAISTGAIFDLSGISNRAKPLVYAMILNQVYNRCEEFDLHGNDSIRMMICLEESQLIFNSEEETGASEDLKQRIQNFRKKGIGLLLITHNVTDIGVGIRRLCQNKFYFRQSSDIARYAANDLVFDEKDYDRIIGMLKTLGQRRCAINAVTVNKNRREVSNSIFATTNEYFCQAMPEKVIARSKNRQTMIKIKSSEPVGERNYKIFYLGEMVSQGVTLGADIIENNLLKNRKYRIIIFGQKRKENKEFVIVGGIENAVVLESNTTEGKT